LRPILPLLTLLLCACGGQEAEAPKPPEQAPGGSAIAGRPDRSHAGTPAPDAPFEDASGEPVSFADFRGKPLLVNLWATWCAPCIAEMPTLDALAAREPRLQVLALSQDLDGRQKVDAFFEQRKLAKLEAYLDSEMSMMGALKVQTLPTTILYDARGREVWRMTGIEDWTGPRARALIAEALKS
jgi:thiol-disulfide isomerase/thioredoxin